MKFKIHTSLIREKILRYKPNTRKWWIWQIKKNGFNYSWWFDYLIANDGSRLVSKTNGGVIWACDDCIVLNYTGKLFNIPSEDISQIIKHIEKDF